MSDVFPALDAEELWESFFLLLYHQHGGSGLSLTLGDLMELELGRVWWLADRLGEQRAREARELEQAARRGSRR